MIRTKRRFGIIPQVAILFALGVLMTGILTFISQHALSDANVKEQTESLASDIANEAMAAVREYPSCEWLLRYWYEHSDELDIEYDAEYGEGTATEEKCRLLSKRHPDIQLKYADVSEIEMMPAEDQKLYAEIVYSWLITRVDQIKRVYKVDYLFCVLTDEPYDTQFFLFSAADVDSVRGTNYEEVYTLGTKVSVGESLQEAMRSARQRSEQLADAGDYVDYYAFLDTIDGHTVLIGLTYDLSVLREDIKSQTVRETALMMVCQICLSLLCLALISRFVLRPLKKVQQNIRLYKQTKDSVTVTQNLSEIRSRNEIGQLSEDVIGLTEEIDDYLDRIETITAEKERIGTELSLANRIQSDMLPNVFPAFPDREEFDIFAAMTPAREVGGDFYDFFLIDDDHLCLVMADVSGKGVPAALFMMASKIILANNAMMGRSPAEILADTNTAICDNNREEMFVTVWLGILELSTGRLTAANAGHEYPVLMHPGRRFELVKDTHGFILGGMEDIRYREYELQLEPGTKLFLYTDGLPEATNAEGHMFGTDRMLAALNERSDAPPARILERVKEAVELFVKDAEQFDDLTMMCISYAGPKGTRDPGAKTPTAAKPETTGESAP